MGDTMSQNAATDGAVLGEEARRIKIERAVSDVLNSEVWRDMIPLPYPYMIAAEVAEALLDEVRALVAEARSEGREDGRAEERERIARDLHEGGYGQAAVRLARQGWPSSPRSES